LDAQHSILVDDLSDPFSALDSGLKLGDRSLNHLPFPRHLPLHPPQDGRLPLFGELRRRSVYATHAFRSGLELLCLEVPGHGLLCARPPEPLGGGLATKLFLGTPGSRFGLTVDVRASLLALSSRHAELAGAHGGDVLPELFPVRACSGCEGLNRRGDKTE
jgi:hypothetical protein